MSEMTEQTGQDAASIAVILDHQYLQGHNSGKTSRGHERPRLVTTIEMAARFGCFKQKKSSRRSQASQFGNQGTPVNPVQQEISAFFASSAVNRTGIDDLGYRTLLS